MSGIIGSARSKSGVIGDPALYYFGHLPANMTSGGTPQWTTDRDTISENVMASGVYTIKKSGTYEIKCDSHYKTTTTSTHYAGMKINRTPAGGTAGVIGFGGYLGDYQVIANTNKNTLQQVLPLSYNDSVHMHFDISGTTVYGSATLAWGSTTFLIRYLGE